MPGPFPDFPKLIKGALIEFSERFIGPIPNIIIFQFNPETLSRSFEVWQPPAPEDAAAAGEAATPRPPPRAQPEDPPESFTLSLKLDAHDVIDGPGARPQAALVGVADRIAAMEMLLYPEPDSSLLGGLLGSVSVSIGAGGVSASAGAAAGTHRERRVPVVLFAWGPGRIVPVRLTSFAVEEQAFSNLLYPIRAKVSIGLKVLSDAEFTGDSFPEDIARAAFRFTRKQKEVLAAANLVGSVGDLGGVLPF